MFRRSFLLLCCLVSPLNADDPPGSLKLVEGRFGKALDVRVTPAVIDGNPRYRTPPLTVECWAKLHSKKEFNVLVASDHKSSGQHWEIYSYAGTGVFSAYLPGVNPSEIKSNSDICDGKWHYLAMTYDSKKVQLFVDGKSVVEQNVGPRKDAKPEAGPLTIGVALHGKHRIGCDGLIDDVRISSTIRKIDGIPDKPLALDIPTVGQWRFDLADAADVDPAWTPRPIEGGAEAWEKETDKDWIDERFQKTDTGPFLGATCTYPGAKEPIYRATAIKLGDKGEAAVLFDRGQLGYSAWWTGGFLKHSSRRFALLNTPSPDGTVQFVHRPGPMWADAKGEWKNLNPTTVPLSSEWGHYRGLHVHGNRVTLSYLVGDTAILDSPWVESNKTLTVFSRTIEVAPASQGLTMRLPEIVMPRLMDITKHGRVYTSLKGTEATGVALVSADRNVYFEADNAPLKVKIAARRQPVTFKLLFWQGKAKDERTFTEFAAGIEPPATLAPLIKPGPTRWKPLTTKGEVGKDGGPFAVDTLTVPYDNPYKALFFISGIDFLPNGDAAVCTAHGDVWLVSGIGEKLDRLTWKRFATGLYQPLGLKVDGGKIVVLERGQLTRLHDTNNDDEADFYENLNSDWHCAGGEHSFDTCLETDPQGNFYFFKTGDTNTPTGGCLLRLSKDGKKLEVFATGFRHPIGLGMSSKGIVTGADQEGNWMPSTRIDQFKQGGFYGDMRAHHRITPPKTYDPPLCWLPRQMDNSAGGQVWVPEGKWGPLSGQMLHLSYGRCRAMLVLRQEIDDTVQAGAVDVGLQFLSGVARGKFNPRDGHLYLVGLRGWQTGAKRDGCLQRVRYTGKNVLLPIGLSAHDNGLTLTFAQKLDAKQAEDVKRYTVEQWNYRWSADYGSQRWSVARPDQVGQDRVPIKSAKLSGDGKSVFLDLGSVKPVMQMQIRYGISSADGETLTGVIYNTIHRTTAHR